jgi:FAD/FMN-containing dehydrogenase
MSTDLRRRFTGPVQVPGDAAYDTLRRCLNPAVESRPAAVVEAVSVADVRAAVTAVREADAPIAVQATGHGTHAGIDDGILVRTGGMASVLVDPDRRIATVGPGARWEAVLAAARPFGLAPLSGSSPTVGVIGYTLGGGLGWLGRSYGFAADHVIRAEVVTADGRSVTANADRNPDLFWALRGGGGNFGIVTALEFRLHPVERVFAGAAYFPADRAGDIFAAYRTWAAAQPDAMSTAALLRQMPDTDDVPAPVRGRRVVVVKAMYAGEADVARCLLHPLWSLTGPAVHHDMRSIPYAQAAMGGTAARFFDLFESLPDRAVEALAASGSTVEIRHWGGALGRPAADAGPVSHRRAQFSVIVDSIEPDLVEALRPYGIGASFLNFLADPRRTTTAYTAEDLAGLRAVKAAYDPDEVFRAGHRIAPAVRSRRLLA